MKKTGRKLLFISCMAALVLSVSACAGVQKHAYSVAQKVEETVTMPEQYSISYEVQEPGEEMITLVTKACDAEGNIYFSDGQKEILFLNDEGRYRLYEKSPQGNFSESTSGKLYTDDYVKTETAKFDECANQSEQQTAPNFE